MAGFDYQRYLASKRTVEDRALNQFVWRQVLEHLRRIKDDPPLRVLDLGGGVGSMALRLMESIGDLDVHYSLVEVSPASLKRAVEELEAVKKSWKFEFFEAEIYDFLSDRPNEKWDLVVAHAVLDLFDLRTALPEFLSHIRPGKYFYFPINYDGLTIFEPAFEDSFEDGLLDEYHRSMNERMHNGKPSGDSRTGRRVLSELQSRGAEVIAAGASDWVVHPVAGKYPADEVFFLESILQTMEDELRKAKDLDGGQLDKWLETRRNQLTKGELIYIAHQLDVFGSVRR